MAATASPQSDRPVDRAGLAQFLAAASGARRVEIAAMALLAGGAIQENWGVDAEFLDGPFAGTQRLALRTDAPTGIPSSLGRVAEFAVLRAVHTAGVSVPEPLWVCADPAVIGRPFFVMRRVAGTAEGRQITADPRLEPALPDLAARLGRELARIQTIRPPRQDLGFLPTIDAARHIADFRTYLDTHARPRPVLEWAIRWLDTHIPPPLSPVLCHRDFRTGNYMVAWAEARAELTGILDWEFAGWGDPDEDIGWLCCKGWRFARLDREVGGIADRAPFYRAYEAAAGRRLDPARVHFWEVLASVRWAVIALQQADRHLIGGARDLSTAIIGRRASECELELLMLLDGDGPPQPSLLPLSGERVGVRGQAAHSLPAPSPERGLPPAATLSRNAGEGFEMRDRPSGAGLLALGRELLLQELLPLLPAERRRELRLIATAMAIAEREIAAGGAPAAEVLRELGEFYDAAAPTAALPRLQGREKEELARFAAELRVGAFEPCEARGRAARAILWRLTLLKLREGNPGFLARNGFGE